ncbi:polysaccharide deacetylase [Emticicia oligotrophica DSM 17448]|uniref:Polysaccharide deacetylase n=1 Tax=Emticicia oligotrophica (strain DSM 17448 / CIP 109782 / MTCC 6937 / GPTSA100-15) TaxID=929562 RepID=A0ABN4ANE2_EMTOG|nr:polysaccharide deacetylase [Emticicia oligotrophica DSM 17448]
MFLHKTNFLMRALYPNFVWRKPSTDKTIFLTFDDGPIPEVTEFVLETLEKYQAKATFFCIGDNINKHPEVFKRVIKEGHSVGNHTFNHLRGWATEDEQYLENTEKCKAEIEKFGIKTQLFRPPYGRIKRSQARSILSTNEIIMWDVLSGDFSQDLTPETVLNKTIKYTESGSIVLFHDSIKANKRMAYALPKFLEHFSAQGFKFSKL